MPTQNVNLPDQQVTFIHERIALGQFANISEVVRAGLRLLEQYETENDLKLKILQQAVAEGFESIDQGDYEVITSDSLNDFMTSTRNG